MGDHAARTTLDTIPSAELMPINDYLSPIP